MIEQMQTVADNFPKYCEKVDLPKDFVNRISKYLHL